MKNITSVLGLIGFLAIFLFSSNRLSAQMNYGFRAGVSLSTFADNPFLPQVQQTSEARTAFLVAPDFAAFVNFPLTPKLSLQGEIHFLQKGGVVKESIIFSQPGSSVGVEYNPAFRYQVSFIETPLVVKYQLSDKKVGLSVLAGGSIGRAIEQKIKGDQVFYFSGNELLIYSAELGTLDWDEEFAENRRKDNRTDISAVGGIELSKSIGNQKLILDIRYSHDFTSWRTYEFDRRKREVLNRNIITSLGIEF